MSVIAMTREMGSCGKDVAVSLADNLGLEIVHHELIERHLAKRLHLGESAVHRFLEGQSPLWERWKIDADRLSRYTAEEVLQLVAKGNVLIRGWGAAQLLRDVPHVICVRVCAPMEKRIAEIKERLGLEDDELARREIERNDDAHSRTIQRQFGENWRNPTGYDVVINTGYMPIDIGVAILETMAHSPHYQENDDTRAILAEKLLHARVRTVLETHPVSSPFGMLGMGLDVAVQNGTVTLSGVIDDDADFTVIHDLIAEMEGVKSIENKVIKVTNRYRD